MNLPENLNELIKNPGTRRELARNSHFYFFHIYFSHYVQYDTADFQKDIFKLSEDESIRNLVVVAFRGSGKSTIMNTSFPIWSILGKPQCKYILVVGLTQEQAKRHLKNIKQELESNELLKKDLGPFKEIENDWSAYSIEIPEMGARISAVSIDQSIRGTRHLSHRPDLIICDDIEDLSSVKYLENRDKVDDTITSEIIPAGTPKTRLVMIGNLLHEDSVIMRMKGRIERGDLQGAFRMYPLLDAEDNCLWPGKFPDEESIIQEKKRIGKESSWQREYMLHIVTNHEQIVFPEWIKHYEILPEKSRDRTKYRKTYTSVDLAISQGQRADFTAMVSAQVHGHGEDMVIYVLPNPINKRLRFDETIDTAKLEQESLDSKLLVEDVAYQKAAIQHMETNNLDVEGVQPKGDKCSRLTVAARYIERGQVLFPQKGCEKLIQQLLKFGLEKHDDLVDALTMLINYAATKKEKVFMFIPLEPSSYMFPRTLNWPSQRNTLPPY